MKRNRIALAIFALDLAATAALAARLPAQVPVHWNAYGAVDRMGSPWELILLGPGVIALFWILLLAVERIDPLGSQPLDEGAPPAERGALSQLVLSLAGLLAVGHVALLAHLAGVVHLSSRAPLLFLPALLLVMGNFLPRVRPNYFAGLRTPWTLSSETVWRRSNRLAGKLLFYGGLVCLPFIFAPKPALFIIWMSVLIGSALIGVAASYVWWRREQQLR